MASSAAAPSRSARSWQAMQWAAQGSAASRFRLIYSSQPRQVPKVPSPMRRSAARASRETEQIPAPEFLRPDHARRRAGFDPVHPRWSC